MEELDSFWETVNGRSSMAIEGKLGSLSAAESAPLVSLETMDIPYYTLYKIKYVLTSGLLHEESTSSFHLINNASG